MERSSSNLSLLSRTTSEYTDILNIFIEPIPEVDDLGKSEIITKRLSDMETKANEIVRKYRLAKLAHARDGPLTEPQKAGVRR